MATVYVTKYALSTGIRECTVNERWTSYDSDGSVYVNWLGNVVCFSRDDWWDTREQAVERANQMRLEKIASLQKQIAKLEKKVFE